MCVLSACPHSRAFHRTLQAIRLLVECRTMELATSYSDEAASSVLVLLQLDWPLQRPLFEDLLAAIVTR